MNFLSNILGFQNSNLAIDLGTANTLIYEPEQGIVLNQPSVVALKSDGVEMSPFAFGGEARDMLGKTPEKIEVFRPLKDGVVADFLVAEDMVRHFIEVVEPKYNFSGPFVLVCVPAGATPVERRAIKEAVENAGAREVLLVEEPIAAAIGAGMPVFSPHGSMIVDIGGGTTEVAVLSLGGVAYARSERIGGDRMDEAIISYARRYHGLLIGEVTAENIKKEIGSALPPDQNMQDNIMAVKGIDIATGHPIEKIFSESQMAEALNDPVYQIIESVRLAFEMMPPELAGDVIEKGVVLSGGGANLKRIDSAISRAMALPVIIADNPLECVALGAGKILENMKEYSDVVANDNYG